MTFEFEKNTVTTGIVSLDLNNFSIGSHANLHTHILFPFIRVMSLKVFAKLLPLHESNIPKVKVCFAGTF